MRASTTVTNYVRIPLRHNLGLRRYYTRRFLVADVTHPLIDDDFLTHFALLWTVETAAYWTKPLRCPPHP